MSKASTGQRKSQSKSHGKSQGKATSAVEISTYPNAVRYLLARATAG